MRFVLLAVVAALATTVACASSAQAPPAATTPTGAVGVVGPASSAPAVRWWSNAAASAGSTVDSADPTAVAGRLRPSRTGYCSMLRQTLAAGHSAMPGVTTTDPAYATATKAVVAELQHVAPSEVAQAWQTLGTLIDDVATSQGDAAALHTVDRRAVAAASATVRSDARSQCGLNLSAH